MDVPNMGIHNDREEVVEENEQSLFRKLVEDINWLAMNTRIDARSDAIEMASNLGKAQFRDIKKAGRIQLSNPGYSKEANLMVYGSGGGQLRKKIHSTGWGRWEDLSHPMER